MRIRLGIRQDLVEARFWEGAWIVVLFGVSLVVLGCSGYSRGVLATSCSGGQFAKRSYAIVRQGVRAEACGMRVLGFGLSDYSLAAALDALRDEVEEEVDGEYELINLAQDRRFEFYAIAWKRCTVVSADVPDSVGRCLTEALSGAPFVRFLGENRVYGGALEF